MHLSLHRILDEFQFCTSNLTSHHLIIIWEWKCSSFACQASYYVMDFFLFFKFMYFLSLPVIMRYFFLFIILIFWLAEHSYSITLKVAMHLNVINVN